GSGPGVGVDEDPSHWRGSIRQSRGLDLGGDPSASSRRWCRRAWNAKTSVSRTVFTMIGEVDPRSELSHAARM
ncbi:MAG: hypothetical protein ACR2JP_11970, partial [Acidimicrobiia bacterium]